MSLFRVWHTWESHALNFPSGQADLPLLALHLVVYGDLMALVFPTGLSFQFYCLQPGTPFPLHTSYQAIGSDLTDILGMTKKFQIHFLNYLHHGELGEWIRVALCRDTGGLTLTHYSLPICSTTSAYPRGLGLLEP